MYGDLKIIAGTANPQLAMDICDHLGCSLTPALCSTFSDGELRVEISDSVRGHDVFVIQPTCAPANKSLMELCLLLDALKRASAGRITAVIPYFGYARQDRKASPRAPISAKLVSDFLTVAGAQRIVTVDLHAGQIQGFFNCPVDNLYARQDRKASPRAPISAKLVSDFLTVAGAQRIVTVDLHAGQIQGFFNCPVDNLYARPVLLKQLSSLSGDIVMVSPDAGGVERARSFAKKMDASLAVIDKRRDRPNQVAEMHIVGNVAGKTAVLVDDMIDTAGTICTAANLLMEGGAKEVYACASHAVLSGPALERLNAAPFKEIIVTDTIPLGERVAECDKIRVASIAGVLAKSIRNIHDGSSVSALF